MHNIFESNRLFETQWQQLRQILVNCERVRRSDEDEGPSDHLAGSPLR